MVSIQLDVWRDGKLFIAKFRQFPVATQGKSLKEAVNNAREALELYLDDDDVQARLGKGTCESCACGRPATHFMLNPYGDGREG
jgi:predicted RNase H-like HicB family nuclease